MGGISNEIRIIYVVHQRTGLPLFMRYVPDNMVDTSTIKRTLLELKGLDIDVWSALLDAGYYNEKNADATSEVFSVLRHQGAVVYPGLLITSEPVKKMNDIYKHFKIKCPEEIPCTLTEDECSGM